MGPDVRRGGRVCRVPIKFKEYEVEGLVNPSKEPSTISQEVQEAVAQVMSMNMIPSLLLSPFSPLYRKNRLINILC
jgi:hypothetical protein